MVLGHDITAKNRTQDVQISEDVSFDTMLLQKTTLIGLRQAGFLRPSPVQLHGIPLGKCGFDLLLEAKSGTGKTAVFTVISLEKLDLNKSIQVIILAPTREIASQISSVITEIGSQYGGLNVAVVMGGLPVKDDIEKFKENVHIVVGSPGRLRHLIQDKHVDLSSVRLFVLDEADKLMENSFLPDINYIFSQLPNQKQVIMSSATYSDATKQFISKYVRQAQHICPDSDSVLLGVAQKVVIVPHNSNIVKQTKYRYGELSKILNSKQFKQCLIFCNYQVRVGELHRMLVRDKWPAEQLYGQQDQTDRLDALKTLQEYKCRILVSTDLAARGIDASNVDLVINFEPAFEWQTYLHRIGRAGRYGSYGTAVSILSEGKEKTKFKETLAFTNINFNLFNLWDDEPFNLYDTNGTPEIDEEQPIKSPNVETIKKEEKSKDIIWKTLTGQSETCDFKSELPSFTDLCTSLKPSDPQSIETFSDLLQSFSQNEINKNVDMVEFKHVNVVKLPTDVIQFWDNLNPTFYKTQENGHPNDETNTETKSPSNVTNITNENSANKKKHNGNNENLTNGMKKNSSKKYSTEHLKMRKPVINDEDIKLNCSDAELTSPNDLSKNSDDIEIYSTKQNLLKMSLPTDFADDNKIEGGNIINNDLNDINTLSTTSHVQPEPDHHVTPTSFDGKKQGKMNSYNGDVITDDQIYETEQTPYACDSEKYQQNNYSKSGKYKPKNHHEMPLCDTENDPIKQAMINAGLPTAFGKSNKTNHHNKFQSYQKKNMKYNERTKIEKPEVAQRSIKSQDVDVKKVNKLSSSKTFTRENYTQKCLSSAVEINSSDSCENSDNEDEYTARLRHGDTTYGSTFNKSYQCYQQPQKQRSNIEETREKQFDNWYKQLKHQTQYIQHFLYLEELRKL